MKNKHATGASEKHKRRLGVLLIVALVLLALLIYLGGTRTVTLEGFVYDPCGGCFANNAPCKPCTVVLGLEHYLYQELDRLGKRQNVTVTIHNLLHSQAQEILAKRLSDTSTTELIYPVLLVDGEPLFGWEQIKSNLAQQLGAEAPQKQMQNPKLQLVPATQDTVVYFKMKSCRSCKETETLLANRGEAAYDLMEYDIEEEGNLELFETYCLQYGLDSDSTTVPVIFIGNSVLEGYEMISVFLQPYLDAGNASTTYRIHP